MSRRRDGAPPGICVLCLSVVVVCACSPAEGQEETLLDPGPAASVCSDDAPGSAFVDVDSRQLPDYVDSDADEVSADPAVPESRTVEVYDPEADVVYVAVVDRCGRIVGDRGGFLSGDEPGVEAEVQQLEGW